MGNEYRKELRIVKDTGGTEIVIGTTMIKHDLKNNISGFARPNKDGGNPVYKAFNINQIKETYEINGILSDRISDVLIDDSNISTKEDAKQKLVDQFKSTSLLRLRVEDLSNNNLETDKTGFIEALSFEEKSSNENSDYEVTVNFLRSEKQGS